MMNLRRFRRDLLKDRLLLSFVYCLLICRSTSDVDYSPIDYSTADYSPACFMVLTKGQRRSSACSLLFCGSLSNGIIPVKSSHVQREIIGINSSISTLCVRFFQCEFRFSSMGISIISYSAELFFSDVLTSLIQEYDRINQGTVIKCRLHSVHFPSIPALMVCAFPDAVSSTIREDLFPSHLRSSAL